MTSMADQCTRSLTLTDGDMTAPIFNLRFSTPLAKLGWAAEKFVLVFVRPIAVYLAGHLPRTPRVACGRFLTDRAIAVSAFALPPLLPQNRAPES